ncbi:MAG TPA: UDP-N-acetylmuramoyl-L-alanine--D-glutamate ligase [Parachlamydiales bacterium]|nr:MAG: UDP-N-acetylmuramoylalanine--D-glutamate ligase [Chlamydiae bacterium GWA2_50_15]OGN54731.1 MAG: UDP-N-acetylmuramoylalanine--D-glutamate ligase [Chlamydiae bacterium GWF2_49_8]OGN57288.1 MAG: UDP-N-acetylmuramoylalanine--D-glutamate ligase [Chlamydiae bacterium RIFCSPHIGHO2_02_FULL_49_29]OGN70292.1 MAG: UDP-N-acetylmuramoylalanine--D-glutamate ligase [Chlamydiae bacterium RIFCSPLOWO2_02_FULL_49_12]OGN71502.1 MAG: UDP-N-acetylmuramoylalanine--D-glutamate ligase [Chlamydiae bacterium RIF
MATVAVLGLGVSGKAAALFLLAKGYRVFGIEEKLNSEKEAELAFLKQKGVILSSRLSFPIGSPLSFAVVSPGVSPRSAAFQELVAQGVKIIGEADLCLKEARQTILGITGTNGKTTVTLLTEHILRAAGKKARAVGNVGDPFGSYFLQPDPEEILVAELSSFQLETLQQSVFDSAIILNLTPDHLDRHGSMRAYAQAKAQIGRCLKGESSSFFIYHEMVKEYRSLLSGLPFMSFGESEEKIADIVPQEYRKLPRHERENLFAAWLLVHSCGVTLAQFREACLTFKKPAHRIEFVASIDGVRYFNDSKGTNVDATRSAVDAMEGSVYLIVGGVDKGGSYQLWKRAFGTKVKKLLAIGEAAGKILSEMGADYDVEVVKTLPEAVGRAAGLAGRGENVLLSPGCASFDQFRDYKDRGEKYKQLIVTLEERSRNS